MSRVESAEQRSAAVKGENFSVDWLAWAAPKLLELFLPVGSLEGGLYGARRTVAIVVLSLWLYRLDLVVPRKDFKRDSREEGVSGPAGFAGAPTSARVAVVYTSRNELFGLNGISAAIACFPLSS